MCADSNKKKPDRKKNKRFVTAASWLSNEQVSFAENFPYATIIQYLTNFLTAKEEQDLELKMAENILLKDKIDAVRIVVEKEGITTVEEFERYFKKQTGLPSI